MLFHLNSVCRDMNREGSVKKKLSDYLPFFWPWIFSYLLLPAMPEKRKVSSFRGNCLWKGQVRWSKSRRQLHMICVFPSTFIIASGISVSFMKDLLDAFHYTWNLFETLGSGNSHGKSGETWLQRSFFKRHQRVKPLQFLSVKCDHGCVALKVPKLIRYKRQRPTYFGSLISRMLNWIWMDTNWY